MSRAGIPLRMIAFETTPVCTVQMTLSRVIDKMVVDEGRALQPCRYRLFTHMSCIILYPYSTQPCRGYTHVITNTGGNNYQHVQLNVGKVT